MREGGGAREEEATLACFPLLVYHARVWKNPVPGGWVDAGNRFGA